MSCRLDLTKDKRVFNLDQEMERTIFTIIAQAGEARGEAYAALESLRHRRIEEARQCVDRAARLLEDVHQFHAALIRREANGEEFRISLLLIHAEDILMATSSEISLVEKIIDVVEGITA